MSVVERVRHLSVEEYIEGEQYADVRHEYITGQVYAMVGANRAHNAISRNLLTALHLHLRGGACQAYMADMKVRVEEAFFYPDVVVTCEPADAHEFYVERPVLVAEVLSPSTEARDLLDKRIAYQSLPSLTEYVVIAQDRMELRIYRRLDEGWELETCATGDVPHLRTVGLDVPVESLYEDVLSE